MSGMITRWFLGMVMGSTVSSAIVLGANCSYAQITPDATLPNNSSVKLEGNTRTIEGGTRAGSNLFHSFREFSVPTGGTAFFNNATDIQNIISRVTGGSVSNIDGIIRTLGTANLFLINPSGIIFGRNASLNIGGSFVATTANAIGFGNQGFFSASAPNNPELLTVNPNALLFNQIRAASIENNSVADAGLNASSEFTVNGLRVPDGRSLLLVGGDIKMDGGGLNAFGGRVELGGFSGAGTVGLNEDGNNLSLSFPDSVERSNVSLSNGASVAVIADNGGNIAVNARNLEMTGGSILIAGIESGLGSDNSKAGNIEVNATGVINLNNQSNIANEVGVGASGQGGDVNISASTLQVEGGAQVAASTFSSGKGGILSVDAQDVKVIGTSANGRLSGLSAQAYTGSTGDAGSITIKTNTLLVRDGAQVGAETDGKGKGGNLTIDAQDVQLIGTTTNGLTASGLLTSSQVNSKGDAGNLTIKTNTLLVRDGAQVGAGTFGGGKGGNLTVDAQDVQIMGISANGNFASGLYTSVQPNSSGDAGDLTIRTNTLLVRDGAQVSTTTSGESKGGSLKVDAIDIQLIGEAANSLFPSGLATSAKMPNSKDAGDLTIKTNTLLVRNGAQVLTVTYGAGKGGSLTVDASDIQLIGRSAFDKGFGLATSAQPNSTGDAGNLTVKTNTLLVRDGAQIGTSTFGEGKGGNLTVSADKVQVIGRSANDRPSGLIASTQGIGKAGNLNITTQQLLISNGAQATASSTGVAVAGDIGINASSVQLDNGKITSQTRSGNGGNLKLNIADLLLMRRGSEISTTAGTAQQPGDGGNITINAPSGFIVAASKENSDITANAFSGSGGRVTIDATGIFGMTPRSREDLVRLLGTNPDPQRLPTNDITAISQTSPNLSGTVTVNTLGIDPTQGLVNLPVIPVDTKVAQGCYAGGSQAQSEFTITGRGGLPPNPGEPLSTDAVSVNLVTLENPEARHEERNRATQSQSHTREHPQKSSSANPPTQIVEAQGWIVNKNGDVELVAFAPTATPHNRRFNPASCQQERK